MYCLLLVLFRCFIFLDNKYVYIPIFIYFLCYYINSTYTYFIIAMSTVMYYVMSDFIKWMRHIDNLYIL